MAGNKLKRILVLLLCVVPTVFWSYTIRRDYQGPMKTPDFSGIYYGTRCVIHHRDPYNQEQYFRELQEDNPAYLQGLLAGLKPGVPSTFVYPPSALLAMVPLAVLPWVTAQNVFLILTAGSLGLAGWVVWDLAREPAPWVIGFLICFELVNCVFQYLLGNPAGIAVAFCMIAGWCFLKERYVWAGVALLALSLAIKPHNSGFVWLYFLLAGGVLRKRALQTLAAVAALGICSAVWIRGTAPHWPREVSQNVSAAACCGGLNDPGPAGMSARSEIGPLISLQAVVSIFKDDPRFYNPVSYLIAGALILGWAIAIVRKRFDRRGALLALAAVSALSMLPVYHRSHDALLMLLAVPGCAVLWAEGGARRWVSLALTAASIGINSDIAGMLLFRDAASLNISTVTLMGKLTLVLLRPATILLFFTGCFYLWAYMRYEPALTGAGASEKTAMQSAEAV